MIRVVMRDGTEREFVEWDFDRDKGMLAFQMASGCWLHYSTSLVAEVHLTDQKFMVAAE